MTQLVRTRQFPPILAGLVVVALAWMCHAAKAQTAVDLELVLAVDVSLSMDVDEQRLQRDGYVAAFRDPEVHAAIAAGPNGRISVTYMEWAGQFSQQQVVSWTVLDGPETARAFADRLESMPISRARMTSISGALEFSSRLLETSGVKAVRRVIDVSGDGPNNAGNPVTVIRDELVAQGIVINGLPILVKGSTPSAFFDISNLDRYYFECVIGGSGAFMVPVIDVAEFKSAIRRKLLLEIAGRESPAQLIPIQSTAPREPIDCLIGEKQWRRYMEGVPN
jgi:hypothetical protein